MSSTLDLSSAPPRLRSKAAATRRTLRNLRPETARERLAERIQNARDRELLLRARAGRDVCWVDAEQVEPLVTLRMVTYQRTDLLMERALPSILTQSYPRLEVLIVGDHDDERTGQALAGVRDPRVRYVNLPRRPLYPVAGWRRWAELGVAAHNVALELSAGAWLTVCDDDDTIAPDHIERLVEVALRERAELVHSRTLVVLGDGRTATLGSGSLMAGHTTHGSVLFSAGLRFFRYRATCGLLDEPQDWNLWRRMQNIGVRLAASPHVGYTYFPTGPTLTAFRRVADRMVD